MLDPLEQSSRYRLLRRLAVGGMGEVLLAQFVGDTNLRITPGLVVVKRTLLGHPNQHHQDALLREEGRIALRLAHANIVETFALEDVGGLPILSMEYLPGRSVAQVLGAAKRTQQLLPIAVVAAIVRAAACGLHFAHTMRDGNKPLNIVHRDVSPANIFVEFDGRVKVIDFGVAKAEDSEIRTSTGILKGKIGYMSPEQATGEKLDARSDLWSLGVLLWESLLADRLFHGKNPSATLFQITHRDITPPSQLRPDISAELDAICVRLLDRDRKKRFQSAADLVRAIDALPEVSRLPAGVAGVDLGRFLAERFPEEAQQARSESLAQPLARLLRQEPIPSGIVDERARFDADKRNAESASQRDRTQLIAIQTILDDKPPMPSHPSQPPEAKTGLSPSIFSSIPVASSLLDQPTSDAMDVGFPAIAPAASAKASSNQPRAFFADEPTKSPYLPRSMRTDYVPPADGDLGDMMGDTDIGQLPVVSDLDGPTEFFQNLRPHHPLPAVSVEESILDGKLADKHQKINASLDGENLEVAVADDNPTKTGLTPPHQAGNALGNSSVRSSIAAQRSFASFASIPAADAYDTAMGAPIGVTNTAARRQEILDALASLPAAEALTPTPRERPDPAMHSGSVQDFSSLQAHMPDISQDPLQESITLSSAVLPALMLADQPAMRIDASLDNLLTELPLSSPTEDDNPANPLNPANPPNPQQAHSPTTSTLMRNALSAEEPSLPSVATGISPTILPPVEPTLRVVDHADFIAHQENIDDNQGIRLWMVAAGTFGIVAVVLGLAFSWFAEQRLAENPLNIFAYRDVNGADIIVVRTEDSPPDIDDLRMIDNAAPTFFLEASDMEPTPIDAQLLQQTLEANGMAARSRLPRQERAWLALALPFCLVAMGALCLLWVLTALLPLVVRARARWLTLLCLLVICVAAAEWGFWAWPGRARLFEGNPPRLSAPTLFQHPSAHE